MESLVCLYFPCCLPVHMKHWTECGLMLGQHRRYWVSFAATIDQCFGALENYPWVIMACLANILMIFSQKSGPQSLQALYGPTEKQDCCLFVSKREKNTWRVLLHLFILCVKIKKDCTQLTHTLQVWMRASPGIRIFKAVHLDLRHLIG